MKKPYTIIVGIVGVIIALLAGFYLASPWMASSALAKAAKEGDKAKLEALVDFPAVKEGLKSQMNSVMMSAMQNDPDLVGNPFAGLAAMMVPTMVNNAVDMMVTPEGIAAMATARPTQKAAAEASVGAGKGLTPKLSQSYVTIDRFRSRAVQPENAKKYIDFVLERRGLFTWKLVKVDMSEAILKSTTPGADAPTP
jgi:hypothetical protein